MDRLKALEALFPGSRHAILRLIYLEPERWWAIPDLVARLAADVGRLRRQSSALAAGGVLLERGAGNSVEWRANPGFPFFAELQAMAAKCARQRGPGGPETILVVEDEPATAKITRILLESWGYKVLEAHTAMEALELFEAHRAGVRLLLTDVVMPGMTGPELARQLRAANPGLRVLFMSGRSEANLDGPLLSKPFNPAGLARKIREEMDK